MPPSSPGILSSFWLAGCLFLGLKLPGNRDHPASASFGLPSRDGCRPLWDSWKHPAVGVGLKRTPALLVAPECPEPLRGGRLECPDCPAGIGRDGILDRPAPPRAGTRAGGHLVRGDLWTNWLLLTARILHWFNPVGLGDGPGAAAEREAACDELAFAALGEAGGRSAYAATIVELAASLAPSGIAPGLVGLFLSTSRLKTHSRTTPAVPFGHDAAGADRGRPCFSGWP